MQSDGPRIDSRVGSTPLGVLRQVYLMEYPCMSPSRRSPHWVMAAVAEVYVPLAARVNVAVVHEPLVDDVKVNRVDTAGPVAGNAWAPVGVPDAPGPAFVNVNVTVWPEPMADSVFPSASVTVAVNEAVVPRPKPVSGQVKKQGWVTGAGLILVKASRVAVPVLVVIGANVRSRAVPSVIVRVSVSAATRVIGMVALPLVHEGLGRVAVAPEGLALAPPHVSAWAPV